MRGYALRMRLTIPGSSASLIVGGMPIVTVPLGSPRRLARSLFAPCTCSTIACARSRNMRPAAVSAMPRPSLCSRLCPTSSSRRRICRLSAGWVTPSTADALEKLLACATCRKD